MTIKDLSKYPKESTFLGINFQNWIAIIGIFLTIFIILIGTSSRLTAVENQTKFNREQQDECKIELKETKKDVSDMKGDIKEMKFMIKVLYDTRNR